VSRGRPHQTVKVEEGLKEACRELAGRFGEKLRGLVLFGSWAREEAGDFSDVDVLVVVDGIPSGRSRRFQLYNIIRKHVGRDVTLIDMDGRELLREDLEVTPLLLNIAYDGVVLYDRDGKLTALLKTVKKLIEKAGLKRYKLKNGSYGWKGEGKLKVVEV
jgi:predicted nucleotidyltransferase